ncbi:hypothetical protein ACQPZQ_05850 [Pseudonocardia sp. CA-142604]|uniref:hypothetical protein n=1 Tax=Pseudonocardia sp. CA-142604 TaxID=3240024 RepID=UPI003D8EEA82
MVGGYATDSDGKSDHGRRTLALDPVTLEALREHVQRWEEWKREFGHDGVHLFCHPDGRRSIRTRSPPGSAQLRHCRPARRSSGWRSP